MAMTPEEKRKKHAEYQRKRYHSMTPEQKKEFLEKRKLIMKKYREKNKDSINKHIKEYYQEHKEKKRKINKRYYDTHKDTRATLKSLKEENQKLKEELKAVNKGLRKVILKRKKWKERYYKLKREKRSLTKYLEDEINNIKMNYSQINGNYFNMNYTIEAYEDLLERIKSGNGKYE